MGVRGESVAALWGAAAILPSLDWETYSEAGYLWDAQRGRWGSLPGFSEQKRGLGAVGLRAYVEHPSFDVIVLGYDLKDLYGVVQWRPGQPYPHALLEYVKSGGLLQSWNVAFELTVWNLHMVPRYGWPPLAIEQMRCVMAKARASALPGKLKETGAVLKLANQKLAEGDRLIRKFTQPRNPTKSDDSRRCVVNAYDPDGALFLEYNRVDVLSESEAATRIPDLTPTELEVWLTDQRINWRGVQVDLESVSNCIAIVEQAHAKYNAELRTLTGGVVQAASELPAMQAWARAQGEPLYEMTEEYLTSRLADPSLVPSVRRMIEIRQLIGSASVKKLFALRWQTARDGRIHDILKYYAARTGRWTGEGPQPQNLYKGQFEKIDEVERALGAIATRSLELVEYEYGDALECVNGVLRSLFVAKPGHILYQSDYSAIEGVVTAALAGEEWRLEVFRTHGKIYETSASKISGVPFEEILEHKRRTGKHHPLRQTTGKVAELASGFAGWVAAWKKFGAGDFMDDAGIKKAILAWRAESPMIVEMWGGQTRDAFTWGKEPRPELFGFEGCAVAAIQNPGAAYWYRDIAFQVHADVLYIRLPSGRMLTYHEPRLERSQRDYAQPWELEISFMGWNNNREKGPIGWYRMKLYGGIITENVVQAAARDIQALALVRLERAGYLPVLHTHDEIVAEVPIGFGSLKEFEALMSWREEWFKDWPVKASGGWVHPRYGKFE